MVVRAASRTRASDERGVSLVEVLVSALIVALIATAVALALMAGADTDADQRDRSQAAELAQLDQERLKGLSAVQLTDLAPPNTETRTVTLGGTPYTITSEADFLNSTGGASCGSTGAGAAAYYEVVSKVTWGINHRGPVTYASMITPPAGGTLLTEVEDQTGAPLPGVGVTATGADTASASTDAAGCAIFSGLSTGDYTLALSDPGYVDQDDQPANPLDISATVTSTGTATPSGGNPIILGLAGTFTAGLTTNTGSSTVPGQQADAISWYGAGTSDSMSNYECETSSGSTSCPASSGNGTVSAAVPSSGSITAFPFAFTGPSYAGNYTVWAGACKQEEPPAPYGQVSITPGSSQTLAIQEPALNVIVKSNGTQVKPSQVAIRFVSASGTSCNDPSSNGWWYPAIAANAATAPTGALAYPGQPFASTSAGSVSASGKTGTLTVCAAAGGRHQNVTGVQNNSMTGASSVTVNVTNLSSAGSTC